LEPLSPLELERLEQRHETLVRHQIRISARGEQSTDALVVPGGRGKVHDSPSPLVRNITVGTNVKQHPNQILGHARLFAQNVEQGEPRRLVDTVELITKFAKGFSHVRQLQ
jgi:hypothetical protein